MSEEHAAVIEQGHRVYRYVCTEEKVIGETIWMRDRYRNTNGDPNSFLLVNFVDTGVPAHKKAKDKPDRNPSTTHQTNVRKYIRDMERNERLR